MFKAHEDTIQKPLGCVVRLVMSWADTIYTTLSFGGSWQHNPFSASKLGCYNF